ncbi:MAG TPA: hypothetical protein VMA95_22630 [Streptosporangiaceae bacterium]|nr:hypothetical protein [Streptosporangiaceae bacterium]
MAPLISVLILLAVAMIGVYVSWRAGRLDRLHTRLETARASLDAALVRRSSVALELAASGLLDPATSLVLADHAHSARSTSEGRELAESELTRTLRTVLNQPDFRSFLEARHRDGADELLDELESTAHQVFLARKFYNAAVARTIAARRRWLARVLRLAGTAPMPEFFEIDDTLTPSAMDEQGTDMPHLAG